MAQPEVPLVRLLGAGSRVWRLLNEEAGRVARTTHPHTAAAARALSWRWLTAAVEVRGSVRSLRRFAAAWPRAACAVHVTLVAEHEEEAMEAVWSPHATWVTLHGDGVTDAVLASLPATVRALDITHCPNLTAAASFGHLHALEHLNCSFTGVGDAALASLPANLRMLCVSCCSNVTAAASFGHLPALEVLLCNFTAVSNATVMSLPVGLQDLHMDCCRNVTPAVRFGHLLELHTLHCEHTRVGDAVPSLPAGCRMTR